MTAIVMNYTVNPVWAGLKAFFRGLVRSQTILGYSRAAAELARQGYYEESKEVMMRLKKFKESN